MQAKETTNSPKRRGDALTSSANAELLNGSRSLRPSGGDDEMHYLRTTTLTERVLDFMSRYNLPL